MERQIQEENKKEDHFYIFSYKDGIPYYERTCGTRDGANDRVDALKKKGHVDAFYMLNCLPKKYWY